MNYFILLRRGTNDLDVYLFLVPLAMLLILWGSTHIMRFVKQKIYEHRQVMMLHENENSDRVDTYLQPE
ncbi:MAG: hypothetical protein U9R19_10845 [Bacteroidota bacterium]|nr:hypothetical protein [Bacteroidota bacterium]